jgi:hypothetical protein
MLLSSIKQAHESSAAISRITHIVLKLNKWLFQVGRLRAELNDKFKPTREPVPHQP